MSGANEKESKKDAPASLYGKAKLISMTFCQFPSYVDDSLQSDKELMTLINAANRHELDSDERQKYQGELRKRIFDLLDRCLAEDSEHAPALLLYARVASYNCRAEDRPAVIAICGRVLDRIDRVQKGTRAYSLIERDIKEYGSGNYFDQSERWLADYYFDLGNLYLSEHRHPDAIMQFQKAVNLMPLLLHFYCGLSDAYMRSCRYADALALWERAEKLPIEQTMKDSVIRTHHEGVKEAMKKAETLRGLTGKILLSIEESPGILQKDLYRRFSQEEKSDISRILYILDKEGLIIREKKGNTYRLALEKPSRDVLVALRAVDLL